LNGKVHFQGECPDDVGYIEISANIVIVHLEGPKVDEKYSLLDDMLIDLDFILHETEDSNGGYILLKEKL
jgi:hypothetical protein